MTRTITPERLLEENEALGLARELVSKLDQMDADPLFGKLPENRWPEVERFARALVAASSENEALRQIIREALEHWPALRAYYADKGTDDEFSGSGALLERMRAAIVSE